MNWTGWGEAGAEEWAAGMLSRTRHGVLERWGGLLEGVLVVGGFGRGEGSVLKTREGDFRPWNDLDLLLLRRPDLHIPPDTEVQALAWAVELGLDSVDLAWASRADWEGGPQSLFHLEVALGSRTLWGDTSATTLLPTQLGKSACVAEAHRLLSNRAYPLLLLALSPQACESPGRVSFRLNILLKLDMAMGDARLLAAGALPVHYALRPEALRRMGVSPEIRARHAEAVENKLRPTEDWALARRDLASEIYAAAQRWLAEGPLLLASCTASDYPHFVSGRLGSWRRRLKHRLEGGPGALSTPLKLDASLPHLLTGLVRRADWTPGPLLHLWPDRIRSDSTWEQCASLLSHEWKGGK